MILESVLKKHLNKGNEIIGGIAQELIEQTISQGIEIEKHEIVKKLLMKKTPINDIADITGLSVQAIQNIKQEL